MISLLLYQHYVPPKSKTQTNPIPKRKTILIKPQSMTTLMLSFTSEEILGQASGIFGSGTASAKRQYFVV